jgi:VWFA-related protein
MRNFSLLAALLAAASLGIGYQIVPGQLPPGPPPQPGQVASPAEKSAKTSPAAPTKAEETPQPVEATDPNVFRVPVRYVLVPTSVLDPDGHGYVNGLKASDFGLLDNDQPQKVVAENTEVPLSVVLAIQANSDVEAVLPELRRAGLLMQGLVTGEDGDVAVMAFDHRLRVVQDFTKDPDKLQTATEKIQAGSSSARLIDAVEEADHMLKRHDPRNARRRVIILLSRNVDKSSEGKLQETVRSMQFDNVIVYCVDISKALTALMKKPDYPRPAPIPAEGMPPIIGGPAGAANTQTAQAQQSTGNVLNAAEPIYNSIRNLFRRNPAEAFTWFTGGQTYTFATERGLERAISDIGKDLNSQYLLSYSPTNKDEPGFHNIKVSVNRPGLTVRVRPGYWWGGGAAQ